MSLKVREKGEAAISQSLQIPGRISTLLNHALTQVSNEEGLFEARETRTPSPYLTCAHHHNNHQDTSRLNGLGRNPLLGSAAAAAAAASAANLFPPHRQPRLPTAGTTPLLPPRHHPGHPAAAEEEGERPHAHAARGSTREHPGRRAQQHHGRSDRSDRR